MNSTRIWSILVLVLCYGQEPVDAQEVPANHARKQVAIPDFPLTVDPKDLLPTELSNLVTIRFHRTPIEEVVSWVGKQLTMPVSFDYEASQFGSSREQLILTDQLNEQPVYWLLNRLSQIGLGWYVEDEILYISDLNKTLDALQTNSYSLGDLLDSGYQRDDLSHVLAEAIRPESWEDSGGNATREWLEDVLFVKQSYGAHLELRGLLEAIRKHGRKTWAYQPSQHEEIKARLEQKVSFQFENKPLQLAIAELSTIAKVDIRIDQQAINGHSVPVRSPITLSVKDRTVSLALNLLLKRFHLTTTLRDGVVWVVPSDMPSHCFSTAVMDVRDLCQNHDEAYALQLALESQTTASWEKYGGEMRMTFAAPGALVLFCNDRVTDDVAAILERYRQVQRTSKPRTLPPDPIETKFYVLQDDLATSLVELLPKMVQPESWKGETQPNALGTIIRAKTERRLIDGAKVHEESPKLVIEQSVLIIDQTPSVHARICEFIEKMKQGDNKANPKDGVSGPRGRDGMGGGMGGFGGMM